MTRRRSFPMLITMTTETGRGPHPTGHVVSCDGPLGTPEAIRARGVRKAYGEQVALDGVDFTMARGEVLALLGPNGAGKTTLVEILEGHRKADGGQVSVLGFDPGKREPASRGRIGIVLQETGLDPAIKGKEAVGLYSAAYPRRRDADE